MNTKQTEPTLEEIQNAITDEEAASCFFALGGNFLSAFLRLDDECPTIQAAADKYGAVLPLRVAVEYCYRTRMPFFDSSELVALKPLNRRCDPLSFSDSSDSVTEEEELRDLEERQALRAAISEEQRELWRSQVVYGKQKNADAPDADAQ